MTGLVFRVLASVGPVSRSSASWAAEMGDDLRRAWRECERAPRMVLLARGLGADPALVHECLRMTFGSAELSTRIEAEIGRPPYPTGSTLPSDVSDELERRNRELLAMLRSRVDIEPLVRRCEQRRDER